MHDKTAFHNERIAHLVIDQLIQQGIDYFCIAPGSRSTPLTIAIAKHPQARTCLHFDERGLAFHALGYGKACHKPAVIVVTSGTAVANLFPAVMEACNANVPMLLLTADRPPELRECSANQTADQTKLFGDYVRWYFDLPVPEDKPNDNFFVSTISYALFRTMHPMKGPVHINCMLREPFISSSPSVHTPLSAVQYEITESVISSSCKKKWAQRFSEAKRGLIVASAMQSSSCKEAVSKLGKKLGWPILSDVLSGMRSYGCRDTLIPYSDLILKTQEMPKPDFVLHLGDRIVSKTLQDYLTQKNTPYCLVSEHPVRHDPKHIVTDRIVCDPVLFCQEILSEEISVDCTSWLHQWQEAATFIEERLPSLFQEEMSITEPGVIRMIDEELGSNWQFFFANSMPIRDADNFFYPKSKRGSIFANRGVSGIDGNIATAIGLAAASGMPTLAVLGDLATLHDINSLAMLHRAKTPVVLVVINNQGGGIFSFLPVREKKEIVEDFFAAAHPYRFAQAAELFGIPYKNPQTKEQWQQVLYSLEKRATSCLIEINTDREENYLFHKKIQASLCSPTLCTAQ